MFSSVVLGFPDDGFSVTENKAFFLLPRDIYHFSIVSIFLLSLLQGGVPILLYGFEFDE
jgi:hypothetical protein